ncbi:MAG: MgtC/SapB family protein [Phycisphaerae bacterium]
MNWLNELFQPTPVRPDQMVERLVLTLLVAFIIGQFNAWCYKWTHRGVSYSRTFTQALVLIAIVAAMSMSLVASNALIAVGLLGGLAIIRFRTVVRDSRDTAYVFLCLICGMAAGFGLYATAVIGAVAANLAAIYMHVTAFGAWYGGEGLLRFRIPASALSSGAFEEQLSRFCRRHSVISVDETPAAQPGAEPMCQCAYKVRLRDPQRGPELVAVLKDVLQVDAIHLLVEQEHEEVA